MKLSAFTLKLIAIICMTVNHALIYTLDTPFWIKVIGLLFGGFTFPIMAFLMTEGFRYTHDRKKYGGRLAVWAVISQLPFYLLFGYWFFINVLATLFIGLILLVLTEKYYIEKTISLVVYSVLTIPLLCLTAFMDWAFIGVIIILTFGVIKNRRTLFIPCLFPIVYSLLIHDISENLIFYFGSLLSMIFIYAYDGTLGTPKALQNKIGKSLFYIYYPLHLFILALSKYIFSM